MRGEATEDAPNTAARVVWCCALVSLLYAALAGRLFFLQIYKHGDAVKQARAMRQKTLRLDAPRGMILDRSGTLLVRNEPAATVVLDPNEWYNDLPPGGKETPESRRQAALDGLRALLPDVNVEAVLAERGLTRGASGRYRTIDVAEQISADLGQKIRDEKLPGVGVFPATRRTALDGGLAAHVVGFTGKDGDGLAGLERVLDDRLTGVKGVITAEFDSRLRPIPGTVREDRPAEAGNDVVLTLDADLQHAVEQALDKVCATSKPQGATAVVLDPKSGDILALANRPTFDANHPEAAPAKARTNRAVQLAYEPGSTLKVVTIAAAMEEKLISPTSYFHCSGSLGVGKRTIHCAHGEVHGSETTLDVVRTSCNVATALCAFKLGRSGLYKYEKLFGFGDKTGAGLPGESRGMLSPPDDWAQIKLANVAFGQGISVTPLQLAAAYAAIANDGVYLSPRIVRGWRDPRTDKFHLIKPEDGRRVVSPETARAMRAMLQSVVERGTGTKARLDGYTAGGKTGTAQMVEEGKRGYSGKYVASFVGMAPVGDPQVVILVAVTAPQGAYFGGEVAAPVFREIAEKALLTRRVAPDAPRLWEIKKHGQAGHNVRD
jgi:cell division protein FtsI/penicillin-binding protein 2